MKIYRKTGLNNNVQGFGIQTIAQPNFYPQLPQTKTSVYIMSIPSPLPYAYMSSASTRTRIYTHVHAHAHTPGGYKDSVPHEPLAMPWKPNHAVQSAVCLRLYTHRCAYRSANRQPPRTQAHPAQIGAFAKRKKNRTLRDLVKFTV